MATDSAEVSLSATQLLDLLVNHADAWNRHDLDALMGLFADDCIFEASGGDQAWGSRYEGIESVRAAFAEVLEAMPDAHWGQGRHFVMSPDYGVSQWILTGTLQDGRRIEVHGCDFLTVRAGKIVRKDSYRKQRPPF